LNRPEEALVGVMYDGNPNGADLVIVNERHWALAGTRLQIGDRFPGLVGYEADRAFGSGPALELLARSPYLYLGEGRYAETGSYTARHGATVFAAGTIQWSWGLDDFNAPGLRPVRSHPALQQITRNVLARLGAAPPQSPRLPTEPGSNAGARQ
jgi:hypothetical protein